MKVCSAMERCMWVVLIFLTGHCCCYNTDGSGISIAVVTSDKAQTRLRLIRDSPKALMKRLNSLHKGTKSEDIAIGSRRRHEWVAVDFDYRRKEFFVLDRRNSSLLVIKDDKGYRNRMQLLYQGLSHKVKAIAYDWLRRSLYWGDPAYRSIFRLDIGHLCREKSCDNYISGRPMGRSQRVYPRSPRSKRGVLTSIIGDDLVYPSSVAVDPINARLYWTDDATLASIQSSALDGRARMLVVGGLVRPSGLALDQNEHTLYWVERLSGLSVIKKCDLYRPVCVPEQLSSVSLSRLFDMDFHKGFLITNDLSKKRLILYDIATDQLLRQNWAGTTNGICVAAKDRQPWADFLANEHSLPEQQPVIIPNIHEHGALFLSSMTSGIWVIAKTFAMGGNQAPFIRLIRATGLTTMALDIDRARLFYFSKKTKSIYRVTLHSHIKPRQKTYPLRIVSGWLDSVSALAVDWANGNLYWADRGNHRIMVSDGLGNFVSTLHYTNITDPQDLVIHSEKRLMFWTDVDKRQPRVERSDLDGYNRVTIIKGNIFYERPHALSIDYERDIIYWSDGPYLCSSTLRGVFKGSCKSRDYTSSSTVRAMDMMHDFVVWTDNLGGIQLADMSPEMASINRNSKTYHSEHLFSDVLYYHTSRQKKMKDPCTTSVNEYVKRTRPSPSYSSGEINSFIFDTVSFSYIATSTTTASSKASFPDSTTMNPPSSVLGPPSTLLGKGITCEHLCLQSRSMTQCACATGYWLNADGKCSSGVLVDEFLIFTDLKIGQLFRQFILLPDYYAFPVRGSRHVIDVTLCTVEKRVYWLDAASNTIHSAFTNGSLQNVVFSSTIDFNMTKIVLAPRSRLLYILTSSGDVAVLSLVTKFMVVIVSNSSWAVLDVVVDENRRELFMTATWKRYQRTSTRSDYLNHGLVMRARMDGTDLEEVYVGEGQPWSITLHESYLLWTDTERKGIYKAYLGEDVPNVFRPGGTPVTQLVHLPDSSSPNDVIVVGNHVYFTDRTKQAIQRIKLDITAEIESIGLTSLNDIAGLTYFNASFHETSLAPPTSCRGVPFPQPEDRWKCLCISGVDRPTDERHYCQDSMTLMHRMSISHGLCLIKVPAHGTVRGGYPDSYVLPGQEIEVTCDPGYLLTSKRARTEKRLCRASGGWSSDKACESDIKYKIIGNDLRGYVIFTASSKFVVPKDIQSLDVIVIGGGGGGFDACNGTLPGHRAGMGGMSSFGQYLKAHGGQGGSKREGGRGGKARNLYGGRGQSSAKCLGGGAAGETTPSKACQLGSTSCPFCGVGGALPNCLECGLRKGGCGGSGSIMGAESGAADSYGGGATGSFGGAGGGGGGFSRKTIRVVPQEVIGVTVGAAGTPSARPAGAGVVVVGWGARLESLVDKLSLKTPCKPFTRGLPEKCRS